MSFDTVLPILRHVLQLGAGALVAKGVLDESMAAQAIGGVIALVTVAWWFFTKPKAPPAP